MLIGPQSSGKSTIAKVISFCLWLEKDVLMRRNTDYVSWSFVEKQLLEFHKLKNYLNEGYAIFFVGDAIDFCYTKDMCFAKLKDGFERCKIGKVAYIPAERNAVTLPNIASLKMPEYNTRSFIFDWLEVHQKFQKKNAVDLLKLKLKYYYDESSQKDMIVLEDGKEIGLEEASSGLQSVVPLYVYVYYLTHWIYDHQEDISFEKKDRIEGALTSTPGLAVAIDSTNSPLASIAYGIAYPFGVIGVILFVKLLPKIMRVDLDKEARRLELERRSGFPELTTCIFRVTNQAVFGRTLAQINARAMTGAVISRVKHGDSILMPKANTMLLEGDYVQAVGSEEALNQFAVLVGEREEGELPLDQTQEIESLLLTKKDMINKQLGDLNLQRNFGCTVTRIRRSGIDLSPSPDLALKFGDKLMVVGEREGLRGVARLLGNNAKQLSDTDFFPIAMGIVLGVLFGKINISFSDSVSFSPGLTGGVLMVALLLSAVGKTGPILWSMSGPANQLLRQLGLLLFLAEVGTSAGKNLVATFQESGLLLFGVGAAITVVPMLVAVVVGRLVFKISLLDLLGTITGGMTSTPGLAAADSMVDSNIPSVAYATVYPIAMVFLILFIQVIASAVY